MENVIRKLYGMYMDNDNGEENEMSEIHDDLCKAKKEAAYQCYQKLRARLTDEQAEELDVLMAKNMEYILRNWKRALLWDLKQGQG